jgi:hypothetical protein
MYRALICIYVICGEIIVYIGHDWSMVINASMEIITIKHHHAESVDPTVLITPEKVTVASLRHLDVATNRGVHSILAILTIDGELCYHLSCCLSCLILILFREGLCMRLIRLWFIYILLFCIYVLITTDEHFSGTEVIIWNQDLLLPKLIDILSVN